MIKIKFLPSWSLFLLLIPGGSWAATAPIPAAPPVTGSSYILVDHHSGRVLAEQKADEHLEPASLTKIMAMYVIFRELHAGNIKLTDQILISERAWKTSGSRTFAEVGKKFAIEDLLKGAIVQSGNDATVALAEHLAGSEATFAEMMNTQAQRLGMNNSHFVNATGLPDPKHYTSARDLSMVTSATIRDFPEFYKIYSIKEFEFNNIVQHNRNKLLWRDDSVDGVKTGHTQNAGYCLVSSAQREGMRLISVILGSKTQEIRAADTLGLLNYGFRFYETHKLYDARQSLAKVRVWRGSPGEVDIGPTTPVYVTIPRQQYKNLELHLEVTPSTRAPVTADQSLGRVAVSLSGAPVTEVPLVALQASPEGGIFRRVKDTVLLWFH